MAFKETCTTYTNRCPNPRPGYFWSELKTNVSFHSLQSSGHFQLFYSIQIHSQENTDFFSNDDSRTCTYHTGRQKLDCTLKIFIWQVFVWAKISLEIQEITEYIPLCSQKKISLYLSPFYLSKFLTIYQRWKPNEVCCLKAFSGEVVWIHMNARVWLGFHPVP